MLEQSLEVWEQALRRQRRQRLGLAAAAVLGGLWWGFGDRLSALFSGEKNWQGEHVFTAAAPSMLGRVDLRRVHQTLLPDWIVAQAWVDREGPGPARDAEAALRQAITSDENLVALLDELVERVQGDLWTEAERLVFLATAWSTYLDAQDAPWRVEGGVIDLGSGPFFYAKVYEILVDGAVGVGGQPQRIRLMRRADTLNVREAHLGHVVEGEDGGLVVIDRIEDFAADGIWPLLGDDTGASDLERAHGAAVRAEAATQLPAEDLALLQETASARRQLIDAVQSVAERGCDFHFTRIPWQGFDARDRAMLSESLHRGRGQRCPPLTHAETKALVTASETLRGSHGLDRALASLVGWAARATAVHEARHVADQGLGFDPVEAELSAYVAAFSTDGVAALSLFQACRANQGVDGVHAQALRGTQVGCGASPSDLQDQARTRSRELFDHADVVVLAQDFGRSVAVSVE